MRFKDELERLGVERPGGMGVFLMDYAAWFPYTNQDSLVLEASLSTGARGEGTVCDMRKTGVQNNRYPNKGWLCLSGKYGRKICKNGCFVMEPLDVLNNYKYLNIGYGFEGRGMARMSVPVNFGVTENRPGAGLEVYLMIKDPNSPDLVITAYEKTSEMGWEAFTYSIREDSESLRIARERFHDERCMQLTPDGTLEEAKGSGWVVYRETVGLYPSRIEDVMA